MAISDKYTVTMNTNPPAECHSYPDFVFDFYVSNTDTKDYMVYACIDDSVTNRLSHDYINRINVSATNQSYAIWGYPYSGPSGDFHVTARMTENVWNNIQNGQHTLSIVITEDFSGSNPSSFTAYTFNFEKITYPPEITIHSSSPGNVRTGFDIEYSVTDQDDSTGNITIKLDGTQVSYNNSLTLGQRYTYNISTETINSLNQGTHTVTFDSTDSSGNAATQKSITFTNNKSDPAVSIQTSSIGNKRITPFDVSYIPYFDDENTCNVFIYLDKTPNNLTLIDTKTNVSDSQSYTTTITRDILDSIKSNPRTYTIEVRAVDSDNKQASDQITFTNYNSGPELTVQETNMGNIGNSFDIHYSVIDEDEDEIGISIQIDGVEKTKIANVPLGQTLTTTITSQDIAALPNGSHTITVIASDSFNLTDSKTITFEKTNTPPIITTPSQTLGKIERGFEVTYTITDPEDDSCSVLVTMDGDTLQEEENITLGQEYSFAITSEMLSEALTREGSIEKTITIYAEDNRGGSSSIDITFINEWRAINMIEIHTDYADVGEISEPFTAYYYITDDDGNRVQAKIYIDDALVSSISNVVLEQEYSVAITKQKMDQLGYDTHVIKIFASNNWGFEAIKYINFQIVSPNLARMQHFTIDVVDNEIKFLQVKQHDHKTRFAKIELTDQGRRIKVSKDYDASIKMKTPDGRLILNDAQVLNDGTVVVEFTDAMLYKSGLASAELVCVFDRYETLLSTPQFNVQILPTVFADEDLENTTHGNNEYSTLVRILTELGGLSSLTERITALEAALANGGGSISVTNYTDPEIRAIVATAKSNADNS